MTIGNTPHTIARIVALLSILLPLKGLAIESAARDYFQCEAMFVPGPVSASIGELRTAWIPAIFSDPRNHDPIRFLYLVHAIDDIWTGLPPGALTDRISEHPNLLKRNPVISISVVNEKHHATWGPSGFILRVPAENIFAASETDMFALNSLDGAGRILHLDDLFSRYGLKSPLDILARSKKDQLNEVIATGGDGAASIEVIGIFINRSLSISSRSQKRVETLIRTSRRLNLPIVEFSNEHGQSGH